MMQNAEAIRIVRQMIERKHQLAEAERSTKAGRAISAQHAEDAAALRVVLLMATGEADE